MTQVDAAIETYELMSQKYFTHATPTLFNAGTPRPQLSSCFLLAMKEDSIEGIYDTLKRCACISKYAGGIGLSVHNIRATDSYIRGSNGTSNGIVPMLRVYNDTARYVDQGGQISASRGATVPSRRRRASSPGEQAVGGLVFDFEAVRTVSRERRRDGLSTQAASARAPSPSI